MMKARRPFTYDGKQLKAGEVFELNEPSADERVAAQRVLMTAGLAETYDGDDRPAPRRDKRRYRRRDLKAER